MEGGFLCSAGWRTEDMDTSPSLSTTPFPVAACQAWGGRLEAGSLLPGESGSQTPGLSADLAQRTRIPTGQSSLEQGVARSHLGCSVGRVPEPRGSQSTLLASHRAQPC